MYYIYVSFKVRGSIVGYFFDNISVMVHVA